MDMFCRTLPIDYDRLKKESASVKRVLDGAVSVRIRTEMGTDLEIGLRNRSAMTDDGNFSKPGKGGNLPAGETFISPELGNSNGKIVIDGCIAIRGGVVVIERPVELEVEGGFVTGIKGEREADSLRETIAEAEENARRFEKEGMLTEGKGEIYAKNARNLGELGIGLNHKARITGNMLEDEKVYGTCHIAVGQNYDEDAPSLIHLDGVIKNPGIIAFTEDGTPVELMKEGLLQV
jgi:leucyl aminopeptidase (aminopeptidase T)